MLCLPYVAGYPCGITRVLESMLWAKRAWGGGSGSFAAWGGGPPMWVAGVSPSQRWAYYQALGRIQRLPRWILWMGLKYLQIRWLCKNHEKHHNLCCRLGRPGNSCNSEWDNSDQTFSRLQLHQRQSLVIGVNLDGCYTISVLQNQVVTRHYARQ